MSDQLKAIADQLVAHCRNHTEAEGLATLYAADAVSVEPMPMPGTDSREARGLEAIKAKHDWWNRTMEVHGGSTSDAFVHGPDRFAVIFEADATDKTSGQRMQMKEIGLYTVADGKIVREEFFYTM
ncbi:MAG: SnoaL-like domain-containing protein [Paracoccaceae bacterium]